MLLFGFFAYMIGWRFVKTDAMIRSSGKKTRDRIYRICAYIILAAMGMQAMTSFMCIGWITIVNETVMLWAFSLAWAVKAGCFKKLND
jgi:hypothetical protein